MPGQNLITTETLAARIGAPDAPVLIDVCIDQDFELDPRLIPGASRHPFETIETLSAPLQGRDTVVICQKGLKLSQGAAAILRARGVPAKALAGGMVSWAERGLPAIPAAMMPGNRLVASENPSADTLAALWLIKRFAAPDAEVLFVAADACDAVADRFDATVVQSFTDMQSQLCLMSPSLNRVGDVIAGGAPEAPGLTAALTGLNALTPDDLSYMAASLPLFDALHRAFRDASDMSSQTGAAA